MAEIPCPTCGHGVVVEDEAAEGTWITVGCGGCGERIRYCVGNPASTARIAARPRSGSPEGTAPYSTLFHPRVALGDAEEAEGEPTAYFLLAGEGERRIPIPGRRTVFGRAPSDVDLGDPAVSRRHFLVEAVGSSFFLRDLGSSNGTFVNGHRARHVELVDGDEVRAGGSRLRFRRS